jgi:hypothetical protein
MSTPGLVVAWILSGPIPIITGLFPGFAIMLRAALAVVTCTLMVVTAAVCDGPRGTDASLINADGM